MFDWPDASHTSPTRTSFTVIALFPLIFSSNGPPAASGSSFTSHLPSCPAVTVLVCPLIATAIFSPASALPKTGAARPDCNIMWSEKANGSLTSATVGPAVRIPAVRIVQMERACMGVPFVFRRIEEAFNPLAGKGSRTC